MAHPAGPGSADRPDRVDRPDRPGDDDPVVRAASALVGGPLGWRAGSTLTGARGPAVLLALAAVLPVALAALLRQHCRTTGWASPDQYVHACYSDVPALVGTGAAPGGASGQPPTTAVVLRLLDLATGTPRGAFDLSVVLAALCLSVAAVMVVRARSTSGSPWDAALVALSPVVVVAGLVSVDLVGVALLAGALLALARRRPAVAGALVGLAAGVRPVAALVLVALWLVVLVGRREHARARRRSGDAGEPLGPLEALAATAAAVLAAGLVTLAARVGTSTQPGGSRWWDGGGGAGFGSVWLLPSLQGTLPDGSQVPWGPLPATAVSVLAGVGLLVVVLLGAAAAARTVGADPVARLAAVALVLVGGALVVSPSVPVQATLVLLPLAAVAAPRWRDHLLWGLAECAAATGTWLYIYATSSEDGRGLSPGGYAVVLVVRLLAVGWLAAQGVRLVGRRSPRERSAGSAEPGPAAGPERLEQPVA